MNNPGTPHPARPAGKGTFPFWASGAGFILFLASVWVLLSALSALAPPDFYEYHQLGEKLLAGNPALYVIPPLFPFMLVMSGRIFSMFIAVGDAAIWGGRLLSLAGGVLVTWLSLRLLQAVSARLAVPAVTAIVVSPLILMNLSFPLTDMWFLAMMTLTMVLTLRNRAFRAGAGVLLASLTRFEGILLFPVVYLRFARLQPRRLLILLAASILIICDGLYLAYRFFPRILEFISRSLAHGTWFYFWRHPGSLVRILYANLLNFLSSALPAFLRWGAFFLLVALFFIGMRSLFRYSRRMGAGVTLFLLAYISAKGYVVEEGLNRLHTRRLIAFLFVFVFFVLLGALKSLQWLGRRIPSRHFAPFVCLILIFGLLVSRRPLWPGGWFALVFVFLLPGLYWTVRTTTVARGWRWVLFALAAVFFFSLYSAGITRAKAVVLAAPDRGGYAIARWMRYRDQLDLSRMAVYSQHEMIQYYLKRPVQLEMLRMRNKEPGEHEALYWQEYLSRLKRRGIRILVFDQYLAAKADPRERTLKEMLWQEARRQRYFRVLNRLRARPSGRVVACVMVVRKQRPESPSAVSPRSARPDHVR